MTVGQFIIALTGALGGLTGMGTGLAIFLQRKKFRAEAADVITDTALTLVEPLQRRVKEVSAEASEAREATRLARAEVAELRESLTDVLAMLRRWRIAVLSPHVTREELHVMVRADNVDSGPV